MPLIKKYNLVFVHIPKTGGTSIEKAFDLKKEEDNLYGFDVNESGFETSPQHWPISRIRKERSDVKNWFTFSFVRNPYTRVLSEYFYRTKANNWQPIMFDKWLDESYKLKNDHQMSQDHILDDSINFIGKFENFKKCFKRMLRRAGIEANIKLPHVNKSKFDKESLIATMTSSSKKKINAIYVKDFQRFGYPILQ